MSVPNSASIPFVNGESVPANNILGATPNQFTADWRNFTVEGNITNTGPFYNNALPNTTINDYDHLLINDATKAQAVIIGGEWWLQQTCAHGDHDNDGTSERSEVTGTGSNLLLWPGDEIWWATSVIFDVNSAIIDNNSQWRLFHQFFSQDCNNYYGSPGGNSQPSGGSPAFALEFSSDGTSLVMHTRAGVRNLGDNSWGSGGSISSSTVIAPTTKGVRHDFICHSRFSTGADGFHRIWHRQSNQGAGATPFPSQPSGSYNGPTVESVTIAGQTCALTGNSNFPLPMYFETGIYEAEVSGGTTKKQYYKGMTCRLNRQGAEEFFTYKGFETPKSRTFSLSGLTSAQIDAVFAQGAPVDGATIVDNVASMSATKSGGTWLQTPLGGVLYGTFANRPTTATDRAEYQATDTGNRYQMQSGSWVQVNGAGLGANTYTGVQMAPDFQASGLTGATANSRYVGATASGAPTSGTFAVGDFVIDQTAKIWICTTAGSPGTWTQAAGSSSGVTSFNSRTGTVVPTSGDYTAALVTNAADKSSASIQSFTGNLSAPAHVASGLTGAVAASRHVGATASGAPTSGTFAVGDFVIDQTGRIWICTTAGTPGTWVQPSNPDDGIVWSFGQPFQPAGGTNAPGQYHIEGVRWAVKNSGTLSAFSFWVATSSGNVIGQVFDTGNASAGKLTALWTSSSAAVSASSSWQTPWTPNISVSAGQQLYAAIMFDNATAAYGYAGSIGSVDLMPTGFLPAVGGAYPRLSFDINNGNFTPPTTITDSSGQTQGHPPFIMGQVT